MKTIKASGPTTNWIFNNQEFNKFQYALKAKFPKGFLDWSYKPFFNMRITKPEGNQEKGEITGLDTDELNFSLTSPVDMIPQESYDGSINLILTDKRNPPRLINSRFTVREKNTYERVDRIGENDTNIYDQGSFNLQTSLQKLYSRIPEVRFNGESSAGELAVGNYVFYFYYCDADENETDIVAESSIVSIFKGQNAKPDSIEGGFRDDNSYKSVSFTLKNIDSEYSYIKVRYIRYSADWKQHRVLNAYQIKQKYPVKNNSCDILITGLEAGFEISPDIINTQYATISTAGTHAIVQNRLFLGNIEQIDPLYKDLRDISLRIYPTYEATEREKLIGNVNFRYDDYTILEQNYEYYNSNNIYNYVGYAPGEIYRIGIVYIMKDNSLSPVYDIRGKNKIPEYSEINPVNKNDKSSAYQYFDIYNRDEDENILSRQYIENIDEATNEFIDRKDQENSKGVIRIPEIDDLKVYSLRFKIDEHVLDYLKDKVKGFFFVRQKRMPLTLGQALLLPIEKNTSLPAIPFSVKDGEDTDFIEGFMDKDKYLTHDYQSRLLTVPSGQNRNQGCLIFPEYELNQPYYNQFFTGGSEFLVRESAFNNSTEKLTRDIINERHYYIELTQTNSQNSYPKSKLIQVADNLKACGIDSYKFSARAGEAEEGFRYEKTLSDNESKDSWNYVRGSFGPYVGITSDRRLSYGKIVNVYIPGYSETHFDNYFKIRYQDESPYYAISPRQNFDTIESFGSSVYRGDSYICNFTHRLNRNFQDPAAPLNDRIVDKKTWKNNFDVSDGIVKKDKFEDINLGDLNAIKLGSWITIKVRCSNNISIRSNDTAWTQERVLFGHPRSFYPLSPMSTEGSYKIPESNVINDAFASTVGHKEYVSLPETPYYKDTFQTRIFYSDIYINDAYINGYRRFLSGKYVDYTAQYGGIVKLIPQSGNLICVLEHGILKLNINQKTPISQDPNNPIYVGTGEILAETPIVISDTIGSQWKDSIVKSDYYIYGVDTHAKKIWRLGSSLEILSDFKIQQFLNNNITLTENENIPYIGIRDVKTHYNRAKGDIMFTYYDDLNGFTEKVWNICFNEKLGKWTTFYSWVPSFSVNLYNTYFSFDRNTSKYIAKLGMSWENAQDSNSIVLSSSEAPIADNGTRFQLGLKDIMLPEVNNTKIEYTYTQHRDIYGFHDYYHIENNQLVIDDITRIRDIMEKYKMPVALLNVECQVELKNDIDNSGSFEDLKKSVKGYQNYNADLFQQTIAITMEDIYTAKSDEELEGLNLSTWFWRHGKTGLFDITDDILPTEWYEQEHPFEFEFIVNDKIDCHKIFDNLEIISNNAEPESFHYEIIGDCFEFAKDKENMYIRQEATKELYQYNGTDITFDDKYKNLTSVHREIEGSNFYDKSTILPLYYSRQDKLNTVEDYYHNKNGEPTKDFSNLAGGEIVKNSRTNEYSIWNHAMAVDIKDKGGRLRGNMQYKEDKWYVQINPLNIRECNEEDWSKCTWEFGSSNKIPVEITQAPLPNEVLQKQNLSIPEDIPDSFGYGTKNVRGITAWDDRKVKQSETKIKDKWMKVRIRYSGRKLAIIHSIQTLYSISTS